MDDFLKAAFLGIVEGFTEFLPVSSTGHLILAEEFVHFDRDAFTKMFTIVIQLGAILAVTVVFWKRLVPWGKRLVPGEATRVWTLWLYAIVGFVPTGIGGLFAAKWIDAYLFNEQIRPWVVAGTAIIYGILFLFIERMAPKTRVTEVTNLGWKLALAIGAIQLLSLVPGTSRSGVTIIGALLLGVGRVAATEFTFFLALPTMAAATGYSLLTFVKENHGGFSGTELGSLAVGFVAAFLVAWAVILGFVRFVQKNNFVGFGIYRIVLGVAVALWFGLPLLHLFKS